MAECTKKKNLESCRCTYKSCPNHGHCCQCIRNHRDAGEFPACFFTEEGERTYDRSFRNLMKYHR